MKESLKYINTNVEYDYKFKKKLKSLASIYKIFNVKLNIFVGVMVKEVLNLCCLHFSRESLTYINFREYIKFY